MGFEQIQNKVRKSYKYQYTSNSMHAYGCIVCEAHRWQFNNCENYYTYNYFIL